MLADVDSTSENGTMFDARPLPGSPVFNDVDILPSDGFFEQVDYRGAFGHNQWLEDWSHLYEVGRLGISPLGTENEITANLPKEFVLIGNFPNPFNPVTTIKFGLDIPADVTITIYNLMGQEVDAINQNNMNVASGVFLYSIQAGNETRFGKMMFLK